MGNTLSHLTKVFETTNGTTELPVAPSNAELKEAEAVAAPVEIPAEASDNETTEPEARPISKRKQKRLAREEKQRTRKRARREEQRGARAEVKRVRRAERLATLAECTPEERARIEGERVIAMRAGRAEERARREHVRRVISGARSHAVCVDAGWGGAMGERERRSLARQLAYAYSSVRKAAEAGLEPIALSVVGVDTALRESLTSVAAGWESWPIAVSPRSLQDVHPSARIVYLTHDSDTVLRTIDPAAVYVVGGLVDRNRLKGATAARAASLGVPTARFNIDEVIHLQHGTCVLTVNHCIDILLHVANGSSWKDAYLRVLPERKGVAIENAG